MPSDPPSLLLIMALPAESNGVFEAAGVPVTYCGIGKVNAAFKLTQMLAAYVHAGLPVPRIVNFGSAGSHDLPTGALVGCRSFVQRDMDVSALGFAVGTTPYDAVPPRLEFERTFPDLPDAVCGTGDSFATARGRVQCDVLDMEAYALAKVCWLEHASFCCAKFVTDGADHGAARDWQANVDKAAHLFLQLYESLRDGGAT